MTVVSWVTVAQNGNGSLQGDSAASWASCVGSSAVSGAPRGESTWVGTGTSSALLGWEGLGCLHEAWEKRALLKQAASSFPPLHPPKNQPNKQNKKTQLNKTTHTYIAKPSCHRPGLPPPPMNWAFLNIRESSFEMKGKDFCSPDWFRAAPFSHITWCSIRLLLPASNHLNAQVLAEWVGGGVVSSSEPELSTAFSSPMSPFPCTANSFTIITPPEAMGPGGEGLHVGRGEQCWHCSLGWDCAPTCMPEHRSSGGPPMYVQEEEKPVNTPPGSEKKQGCAYLSDIPK